MNIEETINKFNKTLKSKGLDLAYYDLMIDKNKQEYEFYQKHGFHINMDYAYLYPMMMTSF